MIRNILVGYDASRSSEVAVAQALGLAEALGGRIHLVTVVEETDTTAEEELAPGGLDPVEAAMPPAEQDDEEEQVIIPPAVEGIKRVCDSRHIVCEAEVLFSTSPGARLLRRSWLADLVVIGRRSERAQGAPAKLGPTAELMARQLVTPTLICAREYLDLRSVLLPYQASVSGGKALAFAAELCELLNASLDVLVCDRARRPAGAALEAARAALRAYKVEGEHSVSLTSPAEGIGKAAMEREASLVVVPGARKRPWGLPWTRNQALWRALELPNTTVLAYP